MNLENKRYLAKIDWNISDYHRASLTYQQTEEFRPSPYDQFAETVVLSSHWYNIDNITKNTSLQLFSDWSENFSTEVKLSHQKFDQVNGNPINHFYYAESDGCYKQGHWKVFWYGADGIDRIRTYVDHCAVRAPSLEG